MSYGYLKNYSGKNINLMDLAATIDLLNVFVRLDLIGPDDNELNDIRAQLEIIKYRSVQAINDEHTEAKYESNRQR